MPCVKHAIAAAAVLCGAGQAACTTARVNHFAEFARAGTAYAQAVAGVTREAAGAAVDADSAALARARPGVPQGERGRTAIEHDDLLKERVSLLGQLREHARLLETYFIALGAVAGSSAPGDLGAATEELVASMGVVSRRLRDARVGDASIGSISGSVVRITVAGFQRAALESELDARAGALERELDFQHAAMQAIAEQMRTDLAAVLGHREAVEVIAPYRSPSATLPSSWAKRRREILTATAAAASVDAAADAAASLKRSFAALVENRYSAADLEAFLLDIDRILDLIEQVRGLRPSGAAD